MSDLPEPWGFVVTATLHIPMLGDIEKTMCWDRRVAAIAESMRERWRDPNYRFDADEAPIYGRAGGRPVCQKCVKAMRAEIARLEGLVAEANDWNVALVLGAEAMT